MIELWLVARVNKEKGETYLLRLSTDYIPGHTCSDLSTILSCKVDEVQQQPSLSVIICP